MWVKRPTASVYPDVDTASLSGPDTMMPVGDAKTLTKAIVPPLGR